MSLGLAISGTLGLAVGFAYLVGRAAGFDEAVKRYGIRGA